MDGVTVNDVGQFMVPKSAQACETMISLEQVALAVVLCHDAGDSYSVRPTV